MKRLEDKANLPGAEIGEVAHSGESLPTEKDFSGIGAVQSAEHLEERRFAASARAGYGNEVSFLDLQVNSAEGLNPAIFIGACDCDSL